MKYSTDILKIAIAAFCSMHLDSIQNEFDEQLTRDQLESMCLVKNWKRMSKSKNKDGTIERGFNCKPFEDQLRAYVKTTNNDDKILAIIVQGE